ncbi:hypothetical protein MVEN_02378700 [Mycena venus]|uniref:Uncharacterized protein n=1 Tax=Mycena venus TaxID=2733690 RepID=A0A8H7CEL0_9AGAR|nr:hypothetical protein MVEN_02378700 [Mycena venus]
MEFINDTSGQMPDVMGKLAGLAATASVDDIKAQFKPNLTSLHKMSKTCSESAKKIDEAFVNITGLTQVYLLTCVVTSSDIIQEMVLACTYQIGTTKQALASNKSYIKAEGMFSKAIDDVPSGWDLMGMHVVDAATNFLTSAGNALVSSLTMKSQAEEAGLNAFSSVIGDKDTPATSGSGTNAPAEAPVAPTTSPNGVQSQPNTESLSDPAVSYVPLVLALANGIKMLLTGGEGGKPDWTNIRAQGSSKSGATYIQDTLQAQKADLDPSKPVSQKLSPYIDSALAIVADILKIADNVKADDNSLTDQVEPTDTLITNLESLQTSTNLLCQQPGTASTGPATSATPTTAASTDTVTLAVQNAQMKVNQTRAQLEASRESYQKATAELVDQQTKITQTITEMTQLSLTDNTLEQILPVLRKAVGAFTTLRAQFSRLVQFFESIAALVENVMGPTVDGWIKTLEEAASEPQERHLVGITMSAFTRDAVYRQVVTPYKVAILTNKISATYLEVSNGYILPAQRKVGGMMKFAKSNSEAAKDALIQELKKSQDDLAASTRKASAQIVKLVQGDQKTFEDQINTRVKKILKVLKPSIPTVTADLPQHIQGVVDAHVRDTAKTREMQAAVNPALNGSTLV